VGFARCFDICPTWCGEATVDAFIITCEHGGNRIPAAYRTLFRGQKPLLDSHRGYDAGALAVARSLAHALDAPMLVSTTSRLLIDLNRPAGHPHLFSAITRNLPTALRAKIAGQYHEPYWSALEQFVRQSMASGRRTIHVASHSFTPELNGQARCADIGLLYDPGRTAETDLCARWKAALVECDSELRVRRNYPYRGKAAGLTAWMRRCFPADAYVGVELEVNQRLSLESDRCWRARRAAIAGSLRAACVTSAWPVEEGAGPGLASSSPVSTSGPRTNAGD